MVLGEQFDIITESQRVRPQFEAALKILVFVVGFISILEFIFHQLTSV